MAPQYTVGQALPSGATVIADTFVTQPDGTTIETMDAQYPTGAKDHTVITTPGPGTPAANQTTINQNVIANLATLETWIANNPNGAVLTAAQTKVLAKMLVGVGRILLNKVDSVGGS